MNKYWPPSKANLLIIGLIIAGIGIYLGVHEMALALILPFLGRRGSIEMAEHHEQQAEKFEEQEDIKIEEVKKTVEEINQIDEKIDDILENKNEDKTIPNDVVERMRSGKL